MLDPLLPRALFLYPLKISENCGFSDVFKGYKKRTLDSNGFQNKESFQEFQQCCKPAIGKLLTVPVFQEFCCLFENNNF